MRHFWIIAGEASGDVYGARLAEELKRIAAARGEAVRFSGMGGPAMIESGLFDIKVDSTELGVVGVVEVVKHIFTFIGIFFRLVRTAAAERPDAVVLIDYPGFNLLFALAMYRRKIPVVWYVCPHLWVWGKWRLPVLAKICRKMLVIFPFEVEVFAKTRLDVEFVGHPLLDIVNERRDPELKRDPDCFLLLPGSRTMEVTRLMQPMLETVTELAKRHPRLYFVLSAPREKIARLCMAQYLEFRRKHPECPEIDFATGETAKYQQLAGTGLAASGTVTVESAIAGLPLVVVYKLNLLTLLLASLVVRLYRGFFTMVNIIADRMIFEEFLQWHVRCRELLPAVERILPGGVRRAEVEAGMAEVVESLSPQSSSAIGQAALACFQAVETNK
jgi:lipid-A-disaccharide synthase